MSAFLLLLLFVILVADHMAVGLLRLLVSLLRRFVESDVKPTFFRAGLVAWLILVSVAACFLLPAVLSAWQRG